MKSYRRKKRKPSYLVVVDFYPDGDSTRHTARFRSTATTLAQLRKELFLRLGTRWTIIERLGVIDGRMNTSEWVTAGEYTEEQKWLQENQGRLGKSMSSS